MLSRLCIVGAVLGLLFAAWTQQVGYLAMAALFVGLAWINAQIDRAERERKAERALWGGSMRFGDTRRTPDRPPYQAGDET